MLARRLKDKSERQRGDTIVEVLIAVTIVSSVLSGAYVTTNKSLLATRAAQERSSALKLTESQIEQVKGLVTTNPNAVLNSAGSFCVLNQTTVAPAGDPRCTQDATGTQTTVDPKYTIVIARTGNDFKVKTSWTDVSGKQTDQLTLSYRVYK
jgi:type II secretory pathway pseudopilin PulG